MAAAAPKPPVELVDLWKNNPRLDCARNLLVDYRARAAEILTTELPAKISHLRDLIARESDPSSPLWLGHLDTGAYILPRLVRPSPDPSMPTSPPPPPQAAVFNGPLRHGKVARTPKTVGCKNEKMNGANANAGNQYQNQNQNHGDDNSDNNNDIVNNHHDDADNEGYPCADLCHGAGEVDWEADDYQEGDEWAGAPGPRAGSHWHEGLELNNVQCKIMEITLREHEDMIMIVHDLQVWLELEVPLIEDGNSFGAEVQSHLLSKLDDAYKHSNGMHNSTRIHHVDRLKIGTMWVKYPNLVDHASAIAQSDRYDNFLARSFLRRLLATYGGLLTKFERNWDKIINPKGDSERSMY